MAEMKDAHIVEIPVDEEHQQKLVSAMTAISAIQHHPLMEISESPGHLLLLKLWQREEDLFGRRIAMKETRLNSIKSELFQLCFFFFIFHGFFLTILFTSHDSNDDHHSVCRKWWIPSVLSLTTSVVIIFLVQMKLCRYWKVVGQLQREKTDNRAVTRCIQELRMKGASFDLNKEPQNARKMKSSSVEIKWKPITWFDLPGLQIYRLRLDHPVISICVPRVIEEPFPSFDFFQIIAAISMKRDEASWSDHRLDSCNQENCSYHPKRRKSSTFFKFQTKVASEE